MATVGTWRRYEFPGRAVAVDFDGPTLTTAAVVNLRTGETVALSDAEWFHLVERAKYMRSLAIPQHGREATDQPFRRFPRVPDTMACPHCGGYVRGHQFIGADTCSIMEPFPETDAPEPEWHRGCTGCWRTIWHLS